MTAPGGPVGAPELLESRLAYRNPWMTVREAGLRRPDGSDGLYGVVDKPDFVLIVPRERDGFHLVEQYRYPVGSRFWEFPQRSWPEPAKTSAADGDPDGAAGTGGP
ncbi:hypothetical protein ACFW5S_26680 [Streptomyces olivaceus]|uniref:hypothetical protein n=1 Tax=Streptomyces olivaceus TaxID=47716 RepID=UPI00369E238B